MEHKCLGALRPSYKIWEKFLPDVLVLALERDSGKDTHPIELQTIGPRDIQAVFDVITYAKGASVLRMLEDAMGEMSFQTAVCEYINRHQYGNAHTGMLWDVMAKHCDFELKTVMRGWTQREGFPLVHIEKESEFEYKLTQKRFGASGSSEPWSIPIRYITDDSAVHLLFFNTHEGRITLSRPSSWVKLNYKMIGFYLVLYDSEMLGLITANIKKFPCEDRYSLIYSYYVFWDKGWADFQQL